MLSFFRAVGNLFVKPVVHHVSDDRPFRIRSGTALLLLIGWLLFAFACIEKSLLLQVAAGTMFVMGMLSIHLDDMLETRRKPVRRGL